MDKKRENSNFTGFPISFTSLFITQQSEIRREFKDELKKELREELKNELLQELRKEIYDLRGGCVCARDELFSSFIDVEYRGEN